MTSLPVTSVCAFLVDTFTDTFTPSTYLVITTIVISVDCSFRLCDVIFLTVFLSASSLSSLSFSVFSH